MVLPPNRIGGVRGPGGATLDDVVAALTSMDDKLTTIANAQSNTLEQLIFIRDYLVQTIQLAEVNPEEYFGVATFLKNMNNVLNGVGASVQGLEGWALAPAQPATPRSWAYGQQALEAISLVLGNVNAAPVGSTLKDLARSSDTNLLALLECLCEDPPPPPFNPSPPVTGCQNQTPAWIEGSLVLKQAGEPGGTDVYGLVFPSSLAGLAGYGGAQLGSSTNPVFIWLTSENGPKPGANICIAYSFAPGSGFQNYLVGASSDIAINLPNTGFAGNTPPVPETNNQLIEIPNAPGAVDNRPGAFVNFGFAAGSAPDGKVWVMAGDPEAS